LSCQRAGSRSPRTPPALGHLPRGRTRTGSASVAPPERRERTRGPEATRPLGASDSGHGRTES
jgi:hypothetical protein